MKFLFDMNLSPQFIEILTQHGWQAVHWSQIGDVRSDDKEIIHWARDNEYTIITNDLDFGTILAAEGCKTPSVIQVRRLDLLLKTLFPVLEQILTKYEKELEAGAIVVVDERKIRGRLLPINPNIPFTLEIPVLAE
jgi:predicted nuclease of predicted toxin-antitoxin system